VRTFFGQVCGGGSDAGVHTFCYRYQELGIFEIYGVFARTRGRRFLVKFFFDVFDDTNDVIILS